MEEIKKAEYATYLEIALKQGLTMHMTEEDYVSQGMHRPTLWRYEETYQGETIKVFIEKSNDWYSLDILGGLKKRTKKVEKFKELVSVLVLSAKEKIDAKKQNANFRAEMLSLTKEALGEDVVPLGYTNKNGWCFGLVDAKK